MPPYSWRVPGQKAGHVLEGHERDVERVAEPDEPRGLHRRVDVERAGQVRRLIGDDPDAAPAEPREPDDDVLGVVPMHFEERPVVGDRVDEVVHVVRLVRRRRHEASSASSSRSTRIGGLAPRRIVDVVARQVAEQLADQAQALAIVRDGEVRDAAGLVVRHRAAELLLRDFLVRDRLDHVGAGHEHVARALDHDVEVGDRRRVDRAAGAGPHDRGDLRDDAGRQRVAQEDVGVAAERQHAFLDARAARVVQPDDRRAHLHREIHDLDDLRGVGFRERAAEHREVLREGVDRAAVDAAAGRRPRRRRGSICSSIPKSRQRCVTSLSTSSKVPGIEQQIDALARRQLAGVVLPATADLAAAELGAPFERPRDVSCTGHGACFAACAFSQSFRNFSSPMSVSGCLNIASITAAGQVQMSAPRRAASTMCIGCRHRRDQHLGRELVVVEDLDDLADQAHAGRRDVVETADERADVRRADLGREQRLRRPRRSA